MFILYIYFFNEKINIFFVIKINEIFRKRL